MKLQASRHRLPGLLVICSLLAACAPSNSEEREVPGRVQVARIDGTELSGGYSCTDDCSGHEAGYEWAEENGIEDPDDCDGNSNSFIEGCIAYAEEQSGEDPYSEDHAEPE